MQMRLDHGSLGVNAIALKSQDLEGLTPQVGFNLFPPPRDLPHRSGEGGALAAVARTRAEKSRMLWQTAGL